MDWSLDVVGRPVRTLVMGSTAAHCLNDLAFRQRSENLPIELVAVVSNHTALGRWPSSTASRSTTCR